MMVCKRFSSFGACWAICSKEALQHIMNKTSRQQPVQGLKQGCAKGAHALQGEKKRGEGKSCAGALTPIMTDCSQPFITPLAHTLQRTV